MFSGGGPALFWTGLGLYLLLERGSTLAFVAVKLNIQN